MDKECPEKAMKDETQPPEVPGKGDTGTGNLGAELSAEKGKKEKKEAALPMPGVSNTTPKGNIDSSAVSTPKIRPGHPSDSAKKVASAMQRDGEFKPERHGEFNPQLR